MGNINSKLAQEATGIVCPITPTMFAAAADDPARVQLLIDLISYESTDPDQHRLWLDEMSPAARNSLYVFLVALKAAVS